MVLEIAGIERRLEAEEAIGEQYLIARFGATDEHAKPASARTDNLIGVFQDAAALGKRVSVMFTGITLVKLGGDVTRGEGLTSSAAGKAVALSGEADSGVGIALASGISGDIVPLLLRQTDGVADAAAIRLEIEKSLEAGEAVEQYLIAKFGDADNKAVKAAAAVDNSIGVFQAAAALGEQVTVGLTGITQVKLGGDVTRGDRILSDASGKGIMNNGASTPTVGIALASGADGDVIEMLLSLS